jgi:hypothetical protein
VVGFDDGGRGRRFDAASVITNLAEQDYLNGTEKEMLRLPLALGIETRHAAHLEIREPCDQRARVDQRVVRRTAAADAAGGGAVSVAGRCARDAREERARVPAIWQHVARHDRGARERVEHRRVVAALVTWRFL